jgi:hypothetical protein
MSVISCLFSKELSTTMFGRLYTKGLEREDQFISARTDG